MRMFHRAVRALSDLGMALSVIVMIAMTLLILAEVVARNRFQTSTFVMNELVAYGVAAMTMIALGHCLETGTLIRMSMLISMLRRTSLLRRAVEVVAVLLALTTTGVALRYFLRSVERAYSRGYVSETAAQIPLWIPEAIVVAGLGILMLQLLSYLLRLLSGAPPMADQDSEAATATAREH